MATIDKKKKLLPSILDRLLDNEPDKEQEIVPERHQQLVEMRNSVRRDLEALLNTRYYLIEPPEELLHVQSSLFNYGLPDLATINILATEKKQIFIRNLEKVIKDYEPRFKSVDISYLDANQAHDRTLKFRINATLYADPAPETIIFDSTLEPVSRTVSVEEANYG